MGLLFFRSDAAEAELVALLRELGGVLARADGAFAAVFDAAPGEKPAGQALLAGQAVLARDLTPCAIVDLDALLVLPRPEGARSYQSPLFIEDGSYPQADDPPGLLATARAAEVLSDVARRPARRGLVSLVTSMTAVAARRELGRYRLEAELGAGSMGRVYRAFDTKLQRRVALKVLRLEGAAPDPDAVARLTREARLAAALEHPNVVSIFDVGEVDGTPFVSMELVKGKNLRGYVRDASIALAVRLTWLLDVASALAAAHKRGLVHRDIKPENVMLREDGVIKVLDFGIARRTALVDPSPFEPTTSTEVLKGQSGVAGTPKYMAPEQLRDEVLDGRCDQFAWGVMAYELLTGASPWGEGDLGVVIGRLLSVDPPPVRERCPELPVVVAEAVERALSKKAADRFATMDALAAALGGSDLVARARPRIPAPEGSLGLTDTLLAPSGASTPVPLLEAVGAASRAGDPRHRRRALAVSLALGAVLAAGAVLAVVARGRGGGSAAVGDLTLAPHGPSSVPAAEAAYRGALQAYRDASYPDALASMLRAAELDPTMACAWLRIATWTGVGDPVTARRAYGEARKHRATLVERDLALLEALGPMFAQERFDLEAVAERLSALARSRQDAELAFYAAMYEDLRGEFGNEGELLERALALDPRFEEARSFAGARAAYQGQDWRAPLAQCLVEAPGAAACTAMQAMLLAWSGDCDGAERSARSWVHLAPNEARAFDYLASAQHAVGRPVEAVRGTLTRKRSAALRQDNQHGSPDAQVARLTDELGLDVLGGDLAGAEAKARELGALVADKPDDGSHAVATRALVEILLETGRAGEAAALADDFLRRREGWTRDAILDDGGLERDVRPLLLAALAQAGRSGDALRSQREVLLAEWRASTPHAWQRWIWTFAWAGPAETEAQAREALDALARSPPPSAHLPFSFGDAHEGRVLLLAGQAQEAIAPLERATRACVALSYPVAHTRAHYFLGLAREGVGDSPGACAAYAVVLRRWGAAQRPASVTAALTRARAEALHCAP